MGVMEHVYYLTAAEKQNNTSPFVAGYQAKFFCSAKSIGSKQISISN
jgi:hypothetical protein